MAADWIKLEMTTPDKPEVVTLAAALRLDQDAVLGKLVRVWIWADQNSVRGDAMAITSAFLDRLTGKRGFAAALRAVGWLAGQDGALTFPSFTRHNGITAKARAESNRRMARSRGGRDGPPDGDDFVAPPPQPALRIGHTIVAEKAQQKPQPEIERERERESNTNRSAPAPAAAPGLVMDFAPPPVRLLPLPASSPPAGPPAPRPRNLILDALVAIDGSDPMQVTASAFRAAATALAEIRAVCPALTPDEIRRRAAHYRAHHRDLTLTPHALAKHWAKCDLPPLASSTDKRRAGFA